MFDTFQTICYFCIAFLVNYYVEINGSEASIVCANACGGNGLRSERSFEKNKFLKKLIPCYGHPITIPKRVKWNQLSCQEHAFIIDTCTPYETRSFLNCVTIPFFVYRHVSFFCPIRTYHAWILSGTRKRLLLLVVFQRRFAHQDR